MKVIKESEIEFRRSKDSCISLVEYGSKLVKENDLLAVYEGSDEDGVELSAVFKGLPKELYDKTAVYNKDVGMGAGGPGWMPETTQLAHFAIIFVVSRVAASIVTEVGKDLYGVIKKRFVGRRIKVEVWGTGSQEHFEFPHHD